VANNRGRPIGIGHNVVEIPAWHNFVREFVKTGKTYEDQLEAKWCHEALGMQMPTNDMPYGEAKKLELKFLAQMEMAITHILKKYEMEIARDGRGNFFVRNPKDQAEAAFVQSQRKMKRAVKRSHDRMIHLNQSKLTAAERAKTADLMARMAAIKIAGKKIIWGTLKKIKRKNDDDDGSSGALGVA
jgi:hypothetical protein